MPHPPRSKHPKFRVACPSCRNELYFERRPRPDHLVQCARCQQILIVTAEDPLRLKEAFADSTHVRPPAR